MSSDILIREVELDHLSGKTLNITQNTSSDVGCVVWDAALVFINYLSKTYVEKKDDFKDKTVIELGTGTGVVGLAAATVDCKKVYITDLEQYAELAKQNILNNKEVVKCGIQFESLDWRESELFKNKLLSDGERVDVILACECICYEESIASLVSCIEQLCTQDTLIYITYEYRENERNLNALKLFKHLVTRRFHAVEVPQNEHHEVFRSNDIHIIKLRLKTPVTNLDI